MTIVIAEPSVAGGIAGVRLIPRFRRRGPRATWAPVCVADVLDALGAAGPTPVVLARPPWSDPGATAVWSAARALGLDPVPLPAAAAPARWLVALAAAWANAGVASIDRHLKLVGGAAAVQATPSGRANRLAGRRPAVIARWASLVWAPCAYCIDAGGMPGAGCAQCARVIGAAA